MNTDEKCPMCDRVKATAWDVANIGKDGLCHSTICHAQPVFIGGSDSGRHQAREDCRAHTVDWRARCKEAESACAFRLADLLQECRSNNADPVGILAARVMRILRGGQL